MNSIKVVLSIFIYLIITSCPFLVEKEDFPSFMKRLENKPFFSEYPNIKFIGDFPNSYMLGSIDEKKAIGYRLEGDSINIKSVYGYKTENYLDIEEVERLDLCKKIYKMTKTSKKTIVFYLIILTRFIK